MASNKKLYNIYRFDFKKLMNYGMVDFENGILISNQLCSEISIDRKGDCQLFNQTIKALKIYDDESAFEKIFINIDFSSYIESGKKLKDALLKIPNGIKLYINDEIIHVVDFLKSSSMSKKCCVYYINKKYKETIEPRVTFDFNKGNLILSKWYAYSGLSISDATILENIKFNENEIVIIPDSEEYTNVECITAVSVPLLYDKIKNLKQDFKDLNNILDISKFTYKELTELHLINPSDLFYKKQNDIRNLFNEIKAYFLSKDFSRIKNQLCDNDIPKVSFNLKAIINILENLSNYENYTVSQINKILTNLIEEYSDFSHKEEQFLSKELKKYNKNEVYWEKFHVSNYPILVNKYDGQGLIDINVGKQINKLLNDVEMNLSDEDMIDNLLSLVLGTRENDTKIKKGFSFQIRLPFIKGIVHSCDFKQFFKDKNIHKIYGKTFDNNNKIKEYDIDTVKMILTESQFKASGFIKYINKKENETPLSAFFRLMKDYDYPLAISNLEPNNDNRIKLNYQFFSTIPFNKYDLDNIIFRNELYFKNKTSNKIIAEDLINSGPFDNKIYNANNNFYFSTSKFRDHKNKIIKILKKDLLKIKIESAGYRKLICSDLLDLLYYSAYHNSNESYQFEQLKKNEFYAPNTKIKLSINKSNHCILLRNPHYSRNEIAVLKPVKNNIQSEREKYFRHLTGVLMINPLSLTAERLGGADYDGDTIVLIMNEYRNKTIDNLLNKDGKMKYPLIKIPGLQTNKESYNYYNIVTCFENTFSSRVGLISFNAFHESFSAYGNNHNDLDEIMPFYTILSGLEIDSAKKGIKPYLINHGKNSAASFFLDFHDKLSDENVKLNNFKDEINKYSDEHILFKVCSKIYDFETPKLPDKFKLIKNYDIEINNNLLKAISIKLIYDNIINIKNKCNRFKKGKNETTKIISSIYENIIDILIDKNIEDKSFIEELKTENPSQTLQLYCKNIDKYHYMSSKTNRDEFIKKELNLSNISKSTMDVLTNFNNNGSYLLYLTLLYWKLADAKTCEKYLIYLENYLLNDSTDIEDIKKIIENISEEQTNYISQYSAEIKQLIKDKINFKTDIPYNKYVNKTEKIIFDLLRQLAKDIDVHSCLFTVNNILTSSIIFNVFGEHVVELLTRKEVYTNEK